MLVEPTIIGFYSLFSFCIVLGVFDILYFLWFRYRLMPKIWARRRLRSQSIREKQASSSFKLITKRSTINFIYFMFYSDVVIFLACGGALGIGLL